MSFLPLWVSFPTVFIIIMNVQFSMLLFYVISSCMLFPHANRFCKLHFSRLHNRKLSWPLLLIIWVASFFFKVNNVMLKKKKKKKKMFRIILWIFYHSEMKLGRFGCWFMWHLLTSHLALPGLSSDLGGLLLFASSPKPLRCLPHLPYLLCTRSEPCDKNFQAS